MVPRTRDETIARGPSLWRGALAGLAAGLVASAAMNAFQAAAASLAPSGKDDDAEPATVKAADRVSIAVTGQAVPEAARPAAGEAVHYGLGALLGLGYGIVAEYRPEATAGFGSGFGSTVALLLDEAAVPAAGLAPGPTETAPATHLFGLSSHMVFGTTAEAVRRGARHLLG